MTGSPTARRTVDAARRVRLYSSVRTAHLERAKALQPATILYRVRRYDFDEEAAIGLDIRHATALRTFGAIWRLHPDQVEINEPLMLNSLGTSALALAALRLRRLTGGRRALVVTYAIGNDDPFDSTPRRARSRIRRRIEVFAAVRVARRIDRIAYGTDAAQAVYERRLDPLRRTRSALIPALPARRTRLAERTKPEPSARNARIVFLGALVPRKGLPQVLAAWEIVRAARPAATLHILGKGALEHDVLELAARDHRVTVEIDPSRAAIFDRLESSTVLTLPSQPSSTWREQVGLPIVEGLSCGCEIVTTTETGLADWLRDHGHHVITRPGDIEQLANALIDALDSARPAEDIVAELPERDGRLAADDWMFAADGTRR